MARFRLLLWLTPRRLRSSWAILAVTAFGILAAVTLIATGAVFSKVLAEGGLRHMVATTNPAVLDAQVFVRNRPLGPTDYNRIRPKVESIIDWHLGHMIDNTDRSGSLQQDLPVVLQRPAPDLERLEISGEPYFAYLFFLAQFQANSDLVLGRWPREEPVGGGEGLELEVVLGAPTARTLNLGLESQVYLVPFRDFPADHITFTVVGIAEAVDPAAEYWLNAYVAYFALQESDESTTVPMYLPEKAFLNGLGARYPFLLGNYGWRLFLNTDILTADTVKPTKKAMGDLDTDVNKVLPRSLIVSGMENKLTAYERDLKHARSPIFIFISLVTVVVLYFLALATGLLASTQRDEASLLRSRGASIAQMSGLMVAVQGIIALLAVAVGPLLAFLLVRHLLLGSIDPAGDAPIPVDLSAQVFGIAAIGGILSFLVLAASTVGLARLGMVELLIAKARPPSIPLLQRYYVDMLVVAAAGLIWWQIHGRGGFTERDLLGASLEVDPLLLLGPVLALLAAAVILLRLLPLALRAIARIATTVAPAWAYLSLVRIARDPVPHGSLAIMLMMAAALGLFGTSFQPTLSDSQRDQALYTSGGELVIVGSVFSLPSKETLATIEGVETVSPVRRAPVHLLGTPPGQTAILMAVDERTLAEVSWFRDDFAGQGLPQLLRPLWQPPRVRGGIPLPLDAETVGMWVRVDSYGDDEAGPITAGLQTPALWIRVSDSNGIHLSLLLTDLPTTNLTGEWEYYEAALPLDRASVFHPPFDIVSVFISSSSAARLEAGQIALDDITVGRGSNPDGSFILEGFESPTSIVKTWEVLPTTAREPDDIGLAREARTGAFALKFAWQGASQGPPRGLLVPPGHFPLPAIGGPRFFVDQRVVVELGSDLLLPVVIERTTDYFPTLDPSVGAFLMVSLEGYQDYLNRASGQSVLTRREFWMSLDGGSNREETIQTIIQKLPPDAGILDRESAVTLAMGDPLAGGGWNGLTLLGISAAAIAAVLALLAYGMVSVSRGRIDLTMVKVLGLTSRQVLLALTVERVLVGLIGLAAGSALGIWLARWVLGLLKTDPRGDPVIPPMIVSVEGWLVALVLVELLAALGLAIFAAALLVSRLRASDVLRTE